MDETNTPKNFISIKLAQASPISWKEFLKTYGQYLNINVVRREREDGYLVTTCDGVQFFTKEEFEATYQPTTGMEFSAALFMMKQGHEVSRRCTKWHNRALCLNVETNNFTLIEYPADLQEQPEGSEWDVYTPDIAENDWYITRYNSHIPVSC